MRGRRAAAARTALVVGSLAAGVLVATPADAVDQLSPAVRVTGDGCGAGRTVTDAGGVTRGFARCTIRSTPDVVTYVSGQGSRWSAAVTIGRGVPVAAADDGTRTYVLYRSRGAQPRLWLLARTRGGSVSQGAVTTTSGVGQIGTRALTGATLLARDGGWLAVWATQAFQGPADQRVFQAGTLLGSPAPRDTGLAGRSPALAFSRTGVQLALVAAANRVEIAAWRGTRWSSSPLPGGDGGLLPGIEYSGRTTRVAFQTNDGYGPNHASYAQRVDGTSTWAVVRLGGLGETPPAQADEDQPSTLVAAVGATVYLAMPAIASGTAQRGSWVGQRSAGRWSSAFYGDGSGADSVPQSLGASAAGLVLLLRHLGRSSYLSARHS